MEDEFKPKKVAVYARVSSIDGRQATENQERVLKDYCDRKGWDYDYYPEKQSTKQTRPVKQGVLQAVRQGVYDTVVVWKLDRWARGSTELILEIEEMCGKHGANFISVTDNIDLNTASGKLMFQILSCFAEFERNLISERTKIGIAEARRKGKKLGRPFGSKDGKKRKRSGYIIAQAKKSQRVDAVSGVFNPLDVYIDRRHSK